MPKDNEKFRIDFQKQRDGPSQNFAVNVSYRDALLMMETLLSGESLYGDVFGVEIRMYPRESGKWQALR